MNSAVWPRGKVFGSEARGLGFESQSGQKKKKKVCLSHQKCCDRHTIVFFNPFSVVCLRLRYSVSSLIIHEFGFCYIYVFINLLAMKYEKPIKLLSNVYFVVLHVNVSGNQSLTQPSSCSSSSASDFYYLQLLGSS